MKKFAFVLFALCFSRVELHASEVMFEGYYRILLGDKPIGYSIQRYEFDSKDKTFQATSFLRATFGKDTIQESLKAKTNDKFQPLSYQYTSQAGSTVKAIDGTFKGEIMNLKITDGKQLRNETHKIPKGTFFSCFLTYLMLQKPLAVGQAFQYSAIAEEEGASYNGKALLESVQKQNGYETYRILNSFKGERFIANVGIVKDTADPSKNLRGEVLSTESPAKSIKTTLAAEAKLATEGQTLPNKVLLTLFGNVPVGKTHLLSKGN